MAEPAATQTPSPNPAPPGRQPAREPEAPPPWRDMNFADDGAAEDAISGLLGGEPDPEPKPQRKAPQQAAAPPAQETPPDDQGEDAAPPADPAEPSGETNEGDEPAEKPPIDPPRSWSREAREKFAALPPDMQEYVAAREQERDTEVRRAQSEVAELRKASDTDRQAIVAERQHLAQLPPLMQALHAQIASSPWARMTPEQRIAYARDNPADALVLREEFDAQVNRWNAGQAILNAEAQRREKEAEATVQRVLREEHAKLAKEWPEFVSKTEGPKVHQSIGKYLADRGFNAEEISNLRDARMVMVLRDALKGRELSAAALKAKQAPAEAPRVARPGTQALPQQNGRMHPGKFGSQLAALRKSNDTDEQARLLEQFIA